MKGRRTIYTNYKKIDESNIIEVLRKVFPLHQQNAGEMDFLLDYESGEVNPIREKVYRKEIQNFIPDPLANYITEFKLGFEWGNPITFVQSDEDDIEDNEVLTKAISILNQNYRAQKNKTKQQELARFIEICGVGYTYVDINTEYEDGDSYFTIDVLDSRFAFVVRSKAYTDKRIVLAVSYLIDEEGRKLFTCFTKESRFEITDCLLKSLFISSSSSSVNCALYFSTSALYFCLSAFILLSLRSSLHTKNTASAISAVISPIPITIVVMFLSSL